MLLSGKIGEVLLITGSEFFEISSVSFGGAEASFVEVPFGLQVTVPELAAWGYVKITSESRGLTGYSQEKFVPEPIINGFYPVSGLPNETVTLYGRAFSGVQSVTINNLPADFTVNSNTGISVTIPTGNTKGQFKVFGQSGLTAMSVEDFSPMVRISGITPASGIVGSTINIIGENFLSEILFDYDNVGTYLVNFNGATGVFERINNTQLQGVVPSGATSGPIFIYQTINSYYGSGFNFQVLQSPPVITSLSANYGRSGDSIIAYGSNLIGVTDAYLSGSLISSLTGVPTTRVSSLGNVFIFSIPALDIGSYSLFLTTSGGSTNLINCLQIMDTPTITGFTDIGITGGSATIYGTNLFSGTRVYLNSIYNSPVEIIGSGNGSYLEFRIPSNAATHNTIYVTNELGTTSTGDFRIVEAASIYGITPASGRWGDTITISGSGFQYVTSAKFGNYTLNLIQGINSFQFQVPTGSNDVNIVLYSSGNVSTGVYFNVIPPLATVSGIQPTGQILGGMIKISGDYLNSVSQALFLSPDGYVESPEINYSDSYLYVKVPNSAISNSFWLVNRSGQTETPYLKILAPPEIVTFTPEATGYLDEISISGRYFNSDTQFYFRGVSGDLVIGLETVISGDRATTKVPREIKRDYIFASGFDSITSGSTPFTPLPTIISITPTTLNAYDSITMQVANAYEMNTGVLIGISAVRRGNALVGSLTTLQTPSSSGTGFYMFSGRLNGRIVPVGYLACETIYNSGNTIYDSGNLQFNYSATPVTVNGQPPVILSISPRTGTTDSWIIVSGRNFLDYTNVILENVTGGNSSVPTPWDVDDDFFSFQVPGGLWEDIFNITVNNLYGSVTLNSGLVVTHTPVIATLSPNELLTGQSFVIQGDYLQYVTGVELMNEYNSPIPITFSVFRNGQWDSYISGYVPISSLLTNQTWSIAVKNLAGSHTFPSIRVISLQEYIDKRNLSDLEAQMIFFGI